MIIEGGTAAVIVITTHSPFGEPERTVSRWLPYLRLGATLVMTGVAIGVLQLAVTGISLDGGILVMARNVIGVTGIGLLSSLVTGGLLAWILPMGLYIIRRVRPAPVLDEPVDLAGPPAGRPWRLAVRVRGVPRRPCRVHGPRRPHPPG